MPSEDSVPDVELHPRPYTEASNHEPKTSPLENVKNFIRNITVEPLALFYITPRLLCLLSNENMNLQKACLVNLAFNESVCTALSMRDKSGYTTEQEIEVQRLVSSMIPYKSICSILQVFVMIMLGTWSDRTGKRKPTLSVPFFGEISAVMGYLLCIYFFMELSVEYSIFFEAFPSSLFGGVQLLLVSIYSYISSVSDEKSRTVRIGAASMTGRSSMTLGITLSGFMYQYLGFYGVYTIALVFLVCGLLYTIFFVKEVPGEKKIYDVDSDKEACCIQTFSLKSIIGSFKICFKTGPGRRRTKMIIIEIITVIVYSVMAAEDTILYLYTRKQFGWDAVDFSTFKAFKTFLQISGSAFVIVYFSKHLQWNDAKLGILAIISKIIGSLILAFSDQSLYFYIGALAEACNGATVIAVTSIISKTVAQNERAQALSVTGIIESLGPVVTGPLYAMIYYQTVSYFPGAFYIFSMVVNVPVLGLYIILNRIITDNE